MTDGGRRTPFLIVGAIVAVAAVLVALTLRRPEVVTYPPTRPAAQDVGRALVGPILYTVDATDPGRWQYFSFRLGATVDEREPTGWDLAFRRYQVIANGGKGFRGNGGIRDLGAARFEDVRTLPAEGYEPNQGADEPRNPAISSWYSYGFFSHLLTPKPHVWAVRTADGRYAKLEMVGYYCPGGDPGCVTFRYVFQGDGSADVASPRHAVR